MKRKTKPPSPAAGWVGTLSTHRSTWTSSRESPPTVLECTALAALTACFLLLVLLPVLALTFTLIALLKPPPQGWLSGLAETGTSPVLWWLLAIICLGPALGIACMVAQPRVMAFEFDAESRVLRRTFARLSGRRVRREDPFDSIVSIRALYFTGHATAGVFQLNHADHLGSDIPSAELDRHLAWLKEHLGDVVEGELRIDS